MRTKLKRMTSLFLALVMVFTMIPPVALAAVNPSLVSGLASLYDGDEERAREELEALYEAGIIDENGNLVELDVREDGESVELSALAQRISADETVGALTVNGHAATPEQIVQISRVGDLLELVRALDGDVEITDQHVANLEALLAGIADGSVNLSSAIERGSLTLASSGDAASTVVSTGNVKVAGGKYTQPMLDGSDYNENYAFDLLDDTNTAYYVDSRYNGVTLDGTVTLTCDKTTVNPGGTVTVTATLDNAQPLPVSFDWNASGAALGNTVSGTVTWAAGETGKQTFTVTAPAKAADDLWQGGRALVINAGNLKNAAFAKGKTAWSQTVTVSGADNAAIQNSFPLRELEIKNRKEIPCDTAAWGKWYPAAVYELEEFPNAYPFTISVNYKADRGDGDNRIYCRISPMTLAEVTTGTTTKIRNGQDSSWQIGNYIEYNHSAVLTVNKNNNLDSILNTNANPVIVFVGSGMGTNVALSVLEVTVSARAPANTFDVVNITVPSGTYYSGMTVPITVTFSEFAAADSATTLTVNGKPCALLDGDGTVTKKLTFGYTVKDVDTGALNVTALTGVKNAGLKDANLGTSFEDLTKKSFGAGDDVSLVSTGLKTGSMVWDNAKYGVSNADAGEQVVTVMLPLDNANKAWVVNEAVEFSGSSKSVMPLPDHATATATGYLPGAYFSCDGGKTRYPVYVVEDGGASFLVGRFTPPANDSDKLRDDTLNLFLATETLNKSNQADVTKYLPALSKVTDEGYGATEADAGVVMGKSWSYYIKGGVRFEELGITGRTDYDVETYNKTNDENYDAAYNTLKLDETHYVLLRDAVEAQEGQEAREAQNPAQQYDVEVVASAAFMEAVKNGIRAENPSDLTLGYQCSTRKNFSYTSPANFTWTSSNPRVARITMGTDGLGHISFTGESGTVTFTLTVKNGGQPFTLATRTLRVIEGKDPFLNIPQFSKVVPTLTGTDTDVLFASNVTARNAAVNQNTTFTAKLFAAQKSGDGYAKTGDTALWQNSFPSTAANTVTHITVPGGQLSAPGVYALEIGTSYFGGDVTVDAETSASVSTSPVNALSATAYLTVKQAPVKVTLNKLESYSVTSDDVAEGKEFALGYALTPDTEGTTVEYTIQKSGGTVSERTAPTTPGSIPFSASTPTGLKDVYTVTVYARNSGDEPWSVDSLLLTVYNKDMLDIIISDVVAGAIGGTTGGAVDKEKGITVADGTTVTMDNSGKLADYGVTDGAYQLTFSDFNSLRTDMSLQRIISANYGSGVWGLLSDKMKWESSNPDMVSVDYKQGGIYSDIRNYDYVYYAPDTDFLLAGKGETSEPVTITATHANTGMEASFDVTTQTLDNELYMFQFLPKATTEVVYTNGDNVERKLTSNDQGELAVYEPRGITSTVMAKSKVVDGSTTVTYVGTLYPEDLVSGERDIGALQLYPCNTMKLRAIGNAVLTFSKPDGSPYTGSVTIRAGVYKNGEYCPNAQVRDVNGASVNQSGRVDSTADLSATDGKLTVGFDPDQFKNASKDEVLQPGDKVSYVIEYRFGDGSAYRPGYVRLNVASDSKADVKAADSLIQLYTVSGVEDQPQISRQIMQQYYGETPTGYTRDVTGYTESIGVSPRFDKTELYTTLSLPGEAVTTGENGYAAYTAADDFGFALYIASSGKQLTGQTGTKVSKDTQAAQIVELSALEDAPLFVFPFSSMPMARSVYTMTDENLSRDGVTDQGDTPSARVKAQITRGSLTIRSNTLPFGVSNVTHQKDLSQPGGGATEIAAEVKTDLTKRMDIGSAFQSVNVNEMLQKGFAFLGNLSGVAGSDQMFNMIIIPTEDPAVFRIAVLVGGKELENENSKDGLSVNYDPNTLAEDIQEFEKALSDDDDDSNGKGKIEFSFSGALYLTAKCDIVHDKWDVAFTGGSVGTGVKGEYEWSQNFLCGPIPFFVEFKAGFGAEIEVSFVDKDEARAMLLDTTLSLSLEAFAGLGFDLSIVAFKLGIFGQIGAAVNFQYLTQTGEEDMTGTKLSIDGEIGIKMEVKVLLISYKKTFASTRFGWSKKYGSYDAIQREWENNGVATLTGVTEGGRAYAMRLFADGTALVAIEGGGEIENRDYLELAERAWNSGAPARRGLMRAANPNTLTDVQTNAYPYSNPVFTDDGGMFLYISDNDNADEVQSVVSYAVKNGSGYNEGKTLYNTESATLADSDVVASGSGDNAFAAWVKQLESPDKEMKDKTTYDDLGMMMNATEVYAGVYNDSAWTTTRLTENSVADMAPTVASYGDRAIVAWRSLAATELPADGDQNADIAASFNVENNINYRIYSDGAWQNVQVAYNGSTGTVNAIDSAMLSDGTALLVYTVRTGDKATDTETFYTLVGSDGAVKTTGRLTNDSNTDTNAQVTAVGNQFIVGWYTEYDNGEATSHDIRLARVNANGSVDETFPESIGSADISTSFTFSASASNDSIDELSIVWPETDDQGGAMKAVRFYQNGAAIGVTAATDVAMIPAHFTVDQFDAYTGTDGTVHTLILGSDYSGITGINAYDTINLENLPVENTNGTDYLTILGQTPVAHIKLGSGSFAENDIEAVASFDIEEAVPGLELPVQFTVTNTGTSKIESVTISGLGEPRTFAVSLLPNQSTAVTVLYPVPEGAVNDPTYTATAGTAEKTGKLTLNRPDVGIADMKLLREGNGTRDIQVRLDNESNIPLKNSGKTVKLAFYKDSRLKNQVGEEHTVPVGSLADIDNGLYTYKVRLNVRDFIGNTAEEIPAEGVTVYAKAWVVGGEEPYTSNNSASLFFDGLLTKYGEAATIDTTLLTNGEGGYTVQADIRNNSMQQTDLGDIIVDVLDSSNKVLNSVKMQETSLRLNTEASQSLTKAITVESGTPASVKLRSSSMSVVLDPNGGTCAETSATLTKDGTLSGLLPEATRSGYTFSGWFTQPSGGEKVTPETVFGGNDGAAVKPNEDGVYVVYAQFTRRSSGSGSSTTTTTITAPVTGDTGTVSVTTTLKGSDATIAPLTTEQLDSIVGSGASSNQSSTVAIDVSNLGTQVKAVTIPAETVKAIEAAVSDTTKDADSLTVKLTEGSVTFNADAVKAIATETKGDGLKVNLDDIGTEKLNTAQKSAVSDLTVESVLDAYVTSGSTRISDFKGGSATVSVKHTLKAAQSPAGIVVWYVADDGTRTQIPATFRNGEVVFTVTHFSNYVIAYDAEKAAAAGKLGEFVDLDSSAWYADGVLWALNNGVMEGVGNNRFSPNGDTTRAMVVTMLWRMEGSPAYAGASEFTDVDGDTWYTEAVRWASTEGIVTGYENPDDAGMIFNPNGAVTREQLATMLYRYAQYKKADVSASASLSSYGDAASVSSWAASAMQWAVGSGIINGMDGNLAPKGEATRAQVATMLMRYSTNAAK